MKSMLFPWLPCLALGMLLTAQAQAESVAGQMGFAKPVDVSALEAYRGGSEHVVSEMTLNGTTAGNTANHVATGSNAISSGSFSGMSGLPVVIQNTGANVLIQNAVIVNLQMQ